MKNSKPIIGITMGDPAGIGPELCLKALIDPEVLKSCIPVIFGDADLLFRISKACGIPLPVNIVKIEKQLKTPPNKPSIIDCNAIANNTVEPGKIQRICGEAAYIYIETAIKAAITDKISAIATAPINKESLHLAGISFPGHTEILADLTNSKRICMMMASKEITVSLVSTHTSYKNVPSLLTKQRVLDVIELTASAIQRMIKTTPRIVVCALNPHAGEHGLFGNEEKEIIEPAIIEARSCGLIIEGPTPPDTAFLPEKRKETDAYIVMYHDQGLIPFKMIAFDKGVNITLGLPIIRTSVDHGTAFDIAWQGKASTGSMIESILYAVKLSKTQKQYS